MTPAQTTRVCAYCGKAGVPLTREHVWPRWLASELGRAPEPHVHASEHEIQRVWHAAPATLTVKRLCAACNNGWMARSEQEAAPLLRLLIRQVPVELSSTDQFHLARWALKTATACDLAHRDPAAPAELRAELAESPKMPDGLVVLLARYAGRRHPLMSGVWVRSLDIDIGGHRTRRQFMQLTVSAGPVVFQVLGHDMVGVTALAPAGPKRECARVIWPDPTTCYWPFPTALGDEGLRRFARDP